jgi:hypothetical protein
MIFIIECINKKEVMKNMVERTPAENLDAVQWNLEKRLSYRRKIAFYNTAWSRCINTIIHYLYLSDTECL